MLGRVVHVTPQYAFVTVEGDERDALLHYTQMRDADTVSRGDLIEYELEETPRGFRAKNARRA